MDANISFDHNYLKVHIEREIYYSDDNLFGVYQATLLDLDPLDEEIINSEIRVVGCLPQMQIDSEYRLLGAWQHHAKFGKQYLVSHFKKELPDSHDGIIKFLSSSLFPGIGQRTSEKIVKQLGEDALDRLRKSTNLLYQIKGLTASQREVLEKGIKGQGWFEEALFFLYNHGIGSNLAMKIVQHYKQATIETTKNNPYAMIRDIEGIGFVRADDFASKQGMEPSSPQRFQAAVLHVLQEASLQDGHVYLDESGLFTNISALLGERDAALFDDSAREEAIEQLIDNDLLIQEQDRYYLPNLYYAELGLATKIRKMLSTHNKERLERQFSVAEIYGHLGEIEQEISVSYSKSQTEALVKALSSPIMILTGGPGTGKTTVINGLCKLYARLHDIKLPTLEHNIMSDALSIKLAAPTGRAAKRLSESTGLTAVTIHRLLGWRGHGNLFAYHSKCKLEGKLLIIDEVSMLDIWLCHKLFSAIKNDMQIVLIGDVDQLQSVGAGSVLQQLLLTNIIPSHALSDIFRQSSDSSIIDLVHNVKQGVLPENILEPQNDRRFFNCTVDEALKIIINTVQAALAKGYSIFDVQILAPIYKGKLGIDHINSEVQANVNPPSKQKSELISGNFIFRTGDKVLQLSNHSEHPVFNGDMGIITTIIKDAVEDQPTLFVKFDSLEVGYKKSEIFQLSLAYACSVHKAQGSEFPILILPIISSYRRMLLRNLLYTAVSRSKSFLIICGELRAFKMGIANTDEQKRNSYLKELILES